MALRTCVIDKNKYEYCPHCGKGDPTETWRNIFCSENCRAIYNTCNDYNIGSITKEEALINLGELDLGKLKDFGESFQNTIADIMVKPEPVVTKKKTTRKKKTTDGE